MPRRKFDAWVAAPQSRMAILGASGWVGMALLDKALAAGIAPERLRLFTTRPRLITIRGLALQTEAIDEAGPLGEGDWLVFHAAITGADRVEGGDPVEVRRRNDALMEAAFSLMDGSDIRRLVMVSSGAAHRPGEGSPAKTAYSRLKRDQEMAVLDWSRRTGQAVLLPRIFNLGGPYINNVRNYALGDFILSLAQTGRVAIGAADPVWRTYVHVLEMAQVLLDMALDPAEGGEPFDIAGSEDVELVYLAKRVAEVMDLPAVIDRPPPAGGDGDFYVGDGRRYQAALAAQGSAPALLTEIVADTVAWLRQSGEIN